MSRMSGFNSPFMLGFDHLEQLLERANKSAHEGYPPYNIEQVGEDRLRITVAVAGFGEEDLDIVLEKNQLVLRGKQKEEGDRVYLHRGIASRQFQRSFVLAEGMEVADAALDKGLLHIDLVRPQPERGVQKIDIRSK